MCPYCIECLCLHIFSVCDAEQRENKKGKKIKEVSLWALILEPVKGEKDTYHRVGIARKVVELMEDEYLEWSKGGIEDPEVPKVFGEWEVRTVTII